MNKLVIILGLTLIGAISQAESYSINGESKTKLEVIKALIQEPSTQAVKCQQVELTDKATLRVKKQAKLK